MMSKTEILEELKELFESQANATHIIYDWDGGHCYSGIRLSLPLMELAQRELGVGPEMDEWDAFTNEWLLENEEVLYCYPEVLNQLVLQENPNGQTYCSCPCANRKEFDSMEEYLDYLEGFVELSNSDPDNSFHRTDLLQKYISEQRELLQFNKQLNSALSE